MKTGQGLGSVGGIPMRWLAVATLVALGAGSPAFAQEVPDGGEPLEPAVERARGAWLDHDVGALFERSDTVRLQVPGIAASPSMKPGQAGTLLLQHLKEAKEIGLDLVRIRRLADDHAYAELARSYVVKGTSEERSERVFFGFRQVAGTWRLREVRVTP